MEKLLVLSDIHGNVRRAAAVVTAHTDCTACLFLGDGTRHIEYLRGLAPHMAFVAVRGNCDTFLDGDKISLPPLQFHAISTPGHTKGSSCFVCGNTIFSGDTLFEGCCGRTDLPGGDGAQMLASLKRLAELPGDYHVLPGHGGDTTLERERRTNYYMREAMRV